MDKAKIIRAEFCGTYKSIEEQDTVAGADCQCGYSIFVKKPKQTEMQEVTCPNCGFKIALGVSGINKHYIKENK